MTFSHSLDDQILDNEIDDEDEIILSSDEIALEFKDHLNNALSAYISTKSECFASTWSQIGLSSSVRRGRVHELFQLCTQLIDEADAADRQSLDRLKTYRDTILKQINEMLIALQEPAYQVPSDLSLICTCRVMKRKFEELKSIKDERMAEMLKLLDQRDKLSDLIAESTPQFKTATAIPSRQELCQLQSIVSKLQTEKTKRLNRFRDLRESILASADELQYKPKNDFESIVFAGEEAKYILSNGNINKLSKLNSELEKKVSANEETLASLVKRLEYLWDLLKVAEDDREEILSQYRCKSDDCIRRLRKEQVDKYERERSKRLVEFIVKIEPHVQDWWEKCHISDKEISSFRRKILDYPKGSEELLQAWESELARLKNYYAENEEIFESIKMWHELLDELEDLNKQANDPDIYKNRRLPSTYFMTLAKKKKTCESKIAKIEALLEGCKTVKVDGNKLADYIYTTREGLEFLNKENQKNAKKAARVPISNICKNKSGATNNSVVSVGMKNRFGANTPELSVSPTKMSRPLQRAGTLTSMKYGGSSTKLNIRTPTQVSLGVRNIKRTPSSLSIDSEEIFKTNLNSRLDVNSTFKPFSPALRRRSKSSNDLASPMSRLVLTPSQRPNVAIRRPENRRPFKP